MLARRVEISAEHETDIETFINLLHYDTSGKRGNIALITNGNFERGKLITYNRLLDRLESLDGVEDVYITPNTFLGYKRDTEYIWQVRALYVDLDIFKSTQYSIDEAFDILMDMSQENIIPEPTMVVYSGGGLHVYWRIKDAPKQALKFWQYVERKLIEKLKPIGADPAASDCARVLRVPDTINSKYGLKCKLWHVNEKARYTLSELQEEYFPKEVKEKRVKKISKSKITPILNPYTLNVTRANDLYNLVQYRKGDIEGYRTHTLLYYCYFKGLTADEEELKRLAFELNNTFVKPLRNREVESCVKSALKEIQNYKENYFNIKTHKSGDPRDGLNLRNETLIERLNITENEMMNIPLDTIISKEEKQRRNTLKKTPRGEDGLTDKQREKNEQRKKAHELAAQGFTQKEIAQLLNVSLSTIKRLLKQ